MIKKSNYRKIKDESYNKLRNMVSILFPKYRENNVYLKKNGEIVLIEKGLLSVFKKGIRKHLSYLLFTDIPSQLSILRWGNLSYVREYRRAISIILTNTYSDELISAEAVIDYLYKELFSLTNKTYNEYDELSKILNMDDTKKIDVPVIEASVVENDYNRYEREEEKPKGLTYVIDTFINPLRRKGVVYSFKKMAAAAAIIMAIQLFSVKEKVITTIDNMYFNLNFINSPPVSDLLKGT